MRPVIIVLIFIIVLIALIMAYLLIVSNTRSEKGGPTIFDMMMRNRDEPAGEEKDHEDAPRISKESGAEPSQNEGCEDPPPASEECGDDTTVQTEDAS